MTSPATDRHQQALYIDLELTCWDGPPPIGVTPEIIEIGAVQMDLETLEVGREAAYLVRPRRIEISHRCTEVTGISADDLKSAPSLTDVLGAFIRDFSPPEKFCGTWGNDAALLDHACKSYGSRSPLRNVVDIGHLFWRLFLLKQMPSVRTATDIMGFRFVGAPHTALADARNTALIHAAIIRRMRRLPDSVPAAPAIPVQHAVSTVFEDKLAPFFKSSGSSSQLRD